MAGRGKRRDWRKRPAYFFSGLLLVWTCILIFRENNLYASYLRQDAQAALLLFAMIFSAWSFLFYVFAPSDKIAEPRSAVFFRICFGRLRWLVRLILKGRTCAGRLQGLSVTEKSSLLFLLVKFAFIPTMINFVFLNLSLVNSSFSAWTGAGFSLELPVLNSIAFSLIASLIFLLDTLVFSFSYLFEARILRNKVRSVEPTLLGWFVALICYPPFNYLLLDLFATGTGSALSFSLHPLANGVNPLVMLALNALMILLSIIYLWATFALGFKASNLTNRGIVSSGPYAYVRHPAYITKVLVWWIMLALTIRSIDQPLVIVFSVAILVMWTFIYHLRSYTEERHLITDPDYVRYRKKVKYLYIPGLL